MRAGRRYRLYGLSLATDLALPGLRPSARARADVRMLPWPGDEDPAVRAARGSRPDDWFLHRRLQDASRYLRWTDLFEFLISPDGRTVHYRGLRHASHESLATYLLGQVLSFSLLARGIEPLHATTVVAGDRAIAFLGECGAGKSTIGTALLEAGCRMLTDDLLALEACGAGYRAQPGVPRVKLFPRMARALLGERTGPSLNSGTRKRILPLEAARACRRPVRLGAIYLLTPTAASRAIRIELLTPAEALLELIHHSFNTMVTDPDRLARQFRFDSRVADTVPIKRLVYPHRLALLSRVREAVLADAA